MGKECFESNVVECVFWGNGMVCVTGENEFFCVSDFGNEKSVVKLAGFGEEEEGEEVLCLAVIEPKYTMSENVEVLVGVGDYVLMIEEEGVQRLGEGLGPIRKMAVSGNGKYLAMFTGDGRLLVVLTDFSRVIFEYDCETQIPPEQIAWCGLDSVLLYWDEMLLMVGPSGEPVRYVYDEPLILIPECDGVRILTNSNMEFLQRVPDSTVSIFQIGSTEPGALLYDALDHFDRHSAKADENLRSVRSKLPMAIEACIDAAGHEFDITRQTTLLRAASYGLAFCSQFPRERFQEMCKTLRTLNAVRTPEIGIAISIQQYKLLTAPVLVGRLINANRHLLALRISEYLNMNTEVVIRHWACIKIVSSSGVSDAELLKILLDKLKLCKDISYAAIAAHADKSGRRKLAAMLIDHEPHPSQQVPLLLSIEEEDSALIKAIESGDTDLVYLVLFHIWQKKPPLDFFGTINARPLARDLFIKYARYCDRRSLEDFYLSTGRPQDVAHLLLLQSWEVEKNPIAGRGGGSALQGPRIRLIEDAHKLFAQTKEHMFEAKAAEEHARLLRIQQELETTTKQAIFVGSSISDTIRTCIVLGNHKAAMKVRAEFKVSDKSWYWLKAFALATVRDWDGLEKFSKERKPPGGYKMFVEACIDAGEKSEALKYIPKLTDPAEKSQAYARIGMEKEAEIAASQSKDSELFGRLKLTLAQNSGTASIFDALRDRLSFQGVY